MSRSLTAADRSALIKLASTMPAGSPERKTILAGLAKTKVALGDDADPWNLAHAVKVTTARLNKVLTHYLNGEWEKALKEYSEAAGGFAEVTNEMYGISGDGTLETGYHQLKKMKRAALKATASPGLATKKSAAMKTPLIQIDTLME